MSTLTNRAKEFLGNTFQVPGNGLVIDVIVNATEITIQPSTLRNEKLEKGKMFTYTSESISYKFQPEQYKEFWKEYMKTSDYEINGERMRKALSYAIRMYRRMYGDIFA